jgi:hypothetical protein
MSGKFLVRNDTWGATQNEVCSESITTVFQIVIFIRRSLNLVTQFGN